MPSKNATNEERARDFESKLEEEEQKAQAVKAEIARRYDPREACKRSSEIRVVNHELLGEVRFGVLSILEFTNLKLADIKDDNARARRIIHAMLQKATPDLTLEQVDAIPFDEFTLLNGILGESLPGFLHLAKQASRTGSPTTQMLKQ